MAATMSMRQTASHMSRVRRRRPFPTEPSTSANEPVNGSLSKDVGPSPLRLRGFVTRILRMRRDSLVRFLEQAPDDLGLQRVFVPKVGGGDAWNDDDRVNEGWGHRLSSKRKGAAPGGPSFFSL